MFLTMSKEQYISEYNRKIETLKVKYKDVGINSNEFEAILKENIHKLKNDKSTSAFYKYLICLLKIFSIGLLLYTLYIIILENALNIFLCKLQEFLYPFLRLVRLMAIPVVSTFPALTELYDETCLLENPYFYIKNLDCWVCRDVESVDYHETMVNQIDTSPPFVYKTNQQRINLTHLADIYYSNKVIFDKDSPKIVKNGVENILIEDFFDSTGSRDVSTGSSYYSWKITRLNPVQVIRSIFPRPDIIPRLGISTERFVLIDEPDSKEHKFPDVECSYGFILQTSGVKVVQLVPASECAKECKAITLILKPQHLLWYNWWYWRPITKEVLSSEVSISYMGSYC